jgi:hypothetical protein
MSFTRLKGRRRELWVCSECQAENHELDADCQFCGASEDDPASCECDSTHQKVDTVCRWCWARGRRHWGDPEVTA